MPVALLSEINASKEADREIVLKLVEGTFEDYVLRLDAWLCKEDSPIFKVGNSYRIYSKACSAKTHNLIQSPVARNGIWPAGLFSMASRAYMQFFLLCRKIYFAG